MATCLEIITSAMKLARVLGSGRSSSGSEAEDGLACLQSLYDEWVAGAMFGRLEDVYLTADNAAEEGKRYLLASGVTLTEPTIIGPDDAQDARQPRDLSLYESLTSDGTRSVRLYDRTAWVDLLDLATTDIAPLSGRGSIGLASCLATSGAFCAMFGDTASMNPDVRAASNRFRSALSYKMGSTRDRTASEYF